MVACPQPPAPIQAMLPEEMLAAVFERLPVGSLGAAQCVCSQWRHIGATPELWRAACDDAFRATPAEVNLRMLRAQYRCGGQTTVHAHPLQSGSDYILGRSNLVQPAFEGYTFASSACRTPSDAGIAQGHHSPVGGHTDADKASAEVLSGYGPYFDSKQLTLPFAGIVGRRCF